MGPEHLIRALALTVLAACGGEPAHPPVVPVTPPRHHAQIVRALTTPERGLIVARFQERNGATWQVNDAALASVMVVDPFAGFLRRARDTAARAPAATAVTEEQASMAARGFVKKNADLLGIPHAIVATLADHPRPVAPLDHAPARAAWAVRLENTFPNKGYEAFPEVENKADLEVFVDDDGAPSMFTNVSVIHPRISIDTKPLFGSDDDRVYAKLLGRRVFALTEDDSQLQLGHIERADFQRAQLGIYVSPGPMRAWLTYRLVWGVQAVKASPDGAPMYFSFTWIVDADTGEVLIDAAAPTSSSFDVVPP